MTVMMGFWQFMPTVKKYAVRLPRIVEFTP